MVEALLRGLESRITAIAALTTALSAALDFVENFKRRTELRHAAMALRQF